LKEEKNILVAETAETVLLFTTQELALKNNPLTRLALKQNRIFRLPSASAKTGNRKTGEELFHERV